MRDINTRLSDNRAAREMENQIIADKLAQGIDGIEWLVLHTELTLTKLAALEYWLEFTREQRLDWLSVAADAFVMDSDTFYKKHELNWWICVDEAISILKLLKETNRDGYETAIQAIQLLCESEG